MIDELLENNEVFVARKDARQLKVSDMDPRVEYHPCDSNEGSYVLINGYKYCIVRKKEKIEICVAEDISPKYWEHPYVSAKLWFDAYAEAVEKHSLCTSVYRDVDPNQLLSLLYFFDLETRDYDDLKEVIDAADKVIAEIEKETITIAKRSLIKFFNS